MKTITGAMFVAITLAGPTLAVADSKPTESGSSKPSSYASRPHTTRHIYGSPIEPPIVGRAAHHAHAQQKHATGATRRNVHKAPAQQKR